MNLTRTVRKWAVEVIPPEHLLPDEQPAYVRSFVYLFGIITLVSLVLIIFSGVVLASFGPDWWHVSPLGHFFNSLHFWSVQTFFFFLVLHLWAQFFMGSWRDGRQWTWAVGMVTFLVAIGTAFSGYVSQQNFDSQWIAIEGKDALNSIGIGAYWNLLNFGQMYGWHIVILPVTVALLVATHLFLVRWHGVVRPYPVEAEQRAYSVMPTASDVPIAQPETYTSTRIEPVDGTSAQRRETVVDAPPAPPRTDMPSVRLDGDGHRASESERDGRGSNAATDERKKEGQA